MHAIRAGLNEQDPIIDKLNEEDDLDGFQTLRLSFPTSTSSTSDTDKSGVMPWPPIFERHLNSLRSTSYQPRTRAQRNRASPPAVGDPISFRFEGEGHDNVEEFLASGWLNPLPRQHGIPGWQRLTMMKYYLKDNEEIDYEALWAYEGVVLPGGQIVLGRWWCAEFGTEDDVSLSLAFEPAILAVLRLVDCEV